MTHARRCDYEGSPYRAQFWEDADRAYEDAADRVALRALLPERPGRLVEIGAGYGRLFDLYTSASDVLLLDYAQSLLRDAQDRLGVRAVYVCADLYNLPFATASIDTIVQVRVLHHVEDIVAGFLEVARPLRTGGSYILEHANKRNAKAVVRYLAGRQSDNPFDPTPYEFVELNWDFHPMHVDAALAAAGLTVRARRTASLFRVPALKKRLSAATLSGADAALGNLLGRLAIGPSRYVRAAKLTGGTDGPPAWRCPRCRFEPLFQIGEAVPCERCGTHWPIRDGIHIFRTDLVEREASA
jgi:SAM-dependent methyltransferase